MKKFLNPKTEIGRILLSFKGTFYTVGTFSAIINLLALIPSLYMLQVYDRVLSSRNEITLLMLTLMMLGGYLFSCALELIRSFVLVRVGAQFDMQLNKRLYTAAFEQNLKQAGGNAGQALSDLTTLRQFLTGNALFAFFDAPWFPVYLIVIYFFEPWLGLFATCGVVILVILAIVNERVTYQPLKEANSMAIASNTAATNNLRNAEVIESMGMLPNLMSRWFKLHGKFLSLQAQASQKAGTITAVTKFRAGPRCAARARQQDHVRHDDRRVDPAGPYAGAGAADHRRVEELEQHPQRVRTPDVAAGSKPGP